MNNKENVEFFIYVSPSGYRSPNQPTTMRVTVAAPLTRTDYLWKSKEISCFTNQRSLLQRDVVLFSTVSVGHSEEIRKS